MSSARQRDIRRDKLQLLLNKDAYGIAVGPPKSAETVPTPEPDTKNTMLERNLKELSEKYVSKKDGPASSRSVPLRAQRKQMLSNRHLGASRTTGWSDLEDKSSRGVTFNDVPEINEEEKAPSESMRARLFGKIPFSDPLKKWKDTQFVDPLKKWKEAHIGRRAISNGPDDDQGSQEGPPVKEAMTALFEHLKLRKKANRGDANEKEDLHSDNTDATDLIDNDSTGTVQGASERDDANAEYYKASLDEATTPLENEVYASPNVSPVRPTFGSPSSGYQSPLNGIASTHISQSASPVQGHQISEPLEVAIEKFEQFSKSASSSLLELHQQLQLQQDIIDRLGDPDLLGNLLPAIQRLEFEINDLEPKMMALISEAERKHNDKLQKLTLGFKRSLDSLMEKIDANQTKIHQKATASTSSAIQEYAISFFVLGLSTILLPFSYLYQLTTSKCRKRQRRLYNEARAIRRRVPSE
uniref:Uncharacterized protein n=1 Tax=Spongospora subterranea TaxID=70186 RepID=A0A0H5RAH4_9EUKA|eukprot:CRZ11160.1 hypothetical protein [Spongospora subterranea]